MSFLYINLWICICYGRQITLSYVPVAMLGYDVVAYHRNATGCESIVGDKQYSYRVVSTDANRIERVYEFWFADSNNLKLFQSNPWRFIPRFGGFCSWGICCESQSEGWFWSAVHQGPPAGPDPSNCGFRIHTDGYLYFNIWKDVDVMFFGDDAEKRIADAKRKWIEWYGSLEAGPINHHCFSTRGHETIDDCVYLGQRFAPAVHSDDDIYPNDFYTDPYFDHDVFDYSVVAQQTLFPTLSVTAQPTEFTLISPEPTSQTVAKGYCTAPPRYAIAQDELFNAGTSQNKLDKAHKGKDTVTNDGCI
eukprot:507392_1